MEFGNERLIETPEFYIIPPIRLDNQREQSFPCLDYTDVNIIPSKFNVFATKGAGSGCCFSIDARNRRHERGWKGPETYRS